MATWWKRANQNRASAVGLVKHAEGWAIAKVSLCEQQGWKLDSYRWLVSSGSLNDDRKSLQLMVKSMGLKGLPCHYVLADEDYQLFPMESPGLKGEELVQAMGWQIKDLLPYPVQDAVVDVFQVPQSSAKAGKAMINVVATPQQQVLDIAAELKEVGLRLESVDISELALGSVMRMSGAHPRGEALAILHAGRGELLMFSQGQLAMSRKFDLAYQAGIDDPLPSDQLLLELQRTLDYYERQLGQLPPAKIRIAGKHLHESKLDETFKQALNTPIELLRLEAPWLAYQDEAEGEFSALLATGGALRGLLASGALQLPQALHEKGAA
ncbi:type IV pilus biogenesis protein PilM [Pseudoteredinibacter isoporae]|uniref:type IV pilus biogenesis protein PilM n=1 Tax=Pseudoteredinibacter isoporae TaxID=570281 RepID=UPI00310544D8